MIEAQRTNSFWKKLGWRAEALGWDAYIAWYGAKTIDEASDAGAALARKLGPKLPVHEVARTNVRLCFPEAEDAEIERLLGGMWDNYGRVAGEMPHLDAFTGDEFDRRVEFIGAEKMREIRAGGQSMIILGMHTANWEVMGAALARSGVPVNITYRPANNPLIDGRIQQLRAGYGLGAMTAKGGEGAKQIMQALKSGVSVGLMNDQKMNDGIEVPFFGHPAMTAPGPTRLSMRHNAPMMPVSVRRTAGAYYRVEILDPIEISTAKDKTEAIYETVLKINQWVEREVRANPEQWFWVHRRWAKSIYKTKGATPQPQSAP